MNAPPSKARRPLSFRQTQDYLLRAAGWVIHSRPRTGPTLWCRGGKVVCEAVAVQLLRWENEHADL